MSEHSKWSLPPAQLSLAKNEVHLWRAQLTCAAPVDRALDAALSEDERQRAARFAFPEHRQRYVAARGILRHLLGGYLRQSPADLRFEYSPKDKPALALTSDMLPVTFNVSHSHGLGVFAFAIHRELGVDTEMIRAHFATDEIAERYFSSRELAELRSLPADARPLAFFQCWTRKEAYVKARGEGLGIPLHSFDVSLTPGMPAELRSADSNRWTLRSFEPGGAFAGAVVGEGQDWELRLWDGTPEQFVQGQ